MTFPFRAQTVKTDEPFVFRVTDGPTALNSEVFALTAKPRSPLLLLNTLVRMDESATVAEGDVISYENDVFTVFYKGGAFLGVGALGVKPIKELLRGTIVSKSLVTTLFSQLRFKSNKTIFKLGDSLGDFEGGLLLSINKGLRVPYDTIKQAVEVVPSGKSVRYF